MGERNSRVFSIDYILEGVQASVGPRISSRTAAGPNWPIHLHSILDSCWSQHKIIGA